MQVLTLILGESGTKKGCSHPQLTLEQELHREKRIDTGHMCMEWWSQDDGCWVACSQKPADKSPLCDRHYSMAIATIAAGRKAHR